MLQTETPVAGIRALLENLIDYAGLFPPAKLPLDQAIQNYASFRNANDSWMLNSFVIPAECLSELADHSSLFYSEPPFRFTIIGRGGAGMGEFLSAADKDLMDARRFLEIHGEHVTLDGYQVRLPEDVVDGISSRRMGDILANVVNRIETSLKAQPHIFFETFWKGNWRQRFNALISELSRLNRERELDNLLGFKVRCGGPSPDDFPPSEAVAGAMHSAARSHLPLKFTAGLHHPLRHFRDEFGGEMHGFINVIVAGAFAKVEKLSEPAIIEILEEKDPGKFTFSDTDVGWKEHRMSIEQFRKTRLEFVTGYGSCSFDEPRHDLQTLGLLPE